MKYMYESLLDTLSAKQIKDIIDETLLRHNTKFIYAIDPHELRAYSFPFGFDERKEAVCSPEYIADEHISLYDLLNNDPNKLLILDEYRPEIFSFRDTVYFYSRNARSQIDTAKDSLIRIAQDKVFTLTDWKNHHKIITEYLPFLITYSIGLHSKGIRGLMQLFTKNRVVLDDVNLEPGELPEIFIKTFTENRPGKLSEKLFESVQPRIVARYRSMVEKGEITAEEVPYELGRELGNKERDCRAIDRLISINVALEELYREKKLGQRHIVLFLSSTPRVEELFNDPAFLEFMPRIGDGKIAERPFNFHRKSAQLFLNLILKRSGQDNTIAIRSLELLHDYVSKSNREGKFTGGNAYLQYRKEIADLRETFENYNLLRQYPIFKTEIEEAVKKGNFAMKGHLRELIKIFETSQENESKIIEKSEDALIKLKLIKHFVEAREVLELFKNSEFTSSYGNDYIRGFAHHLPLLFFTNNPATEEYILFISSCYLSSKKLSEAEKVSYLNDIERRGQAYLKANEGSLEPDQWLVVLLLFLLLPADKEVDKERSGLLVLKEVEVMLPMLEDNRYRHLVTEYCYLGSFAARRIQKYDAAEDLVMKGLKYKQTLSVARLKHSECLIWYSRYRFKLEKHTIRDIEFVKKAVKCGQDALKEYDRYSAPFNALNKQKAALYNTLSYLYCLEYEFKATKVLDRAEKYISIVKDLEPDFDLYPEFLDTEATVYFMKYKQTGDQIFLASAKQRITEALKIDQFDSEYIMRLTEIDKEINANL